jgi:secondary thiamine-phosphate synthase enzyme
VGELRLGVGGVVDVDEVSVEGVVARDDGSRYVRVVSVKVHQDTVAVRVAGRGLVDITKKIEASVGASGIATGLCTVFLQHTSASLVIQENADPAVLRDMERWIGRIAPEDAKAYEHDDEGADDMPAHLRASMTKTSEVVPVTNGRLALGTWQAIYLWEHRRTPRTRTLVVHVQGI